MKIVPKISAAKYLKENYATVKSIRRPNKNLYFCTLQNLMGEEIATIKQIITKRDNFTRDVVTTLDIPAINLTKETNSFHLFGNIGTKNNFERKLVLAESQTTENDTTGGLKKLLRRIKTNYNYGATRKGRNYYTPKEFETPIHPKIEEFIPEYNAQIID